MFCECVYMHLCINVCNFICMCVCMHMCVCAIVICSTYVFLCNHFLGLTSIFSSEIGPGHQNQWGVYHCWHRGRRVLLLPVDEDSRDI